MSDKETLYARLLSNELSTSEIEELKSSGEWEEIQQIANLSSKLELPAYNKDDAYKKLSNRNSKSNAKQRKIPIFKILSVAAGILILLGTIFLLRTETTKVMADLASTNTHLFDDKSEVSLNAGSSIEFSEKNWLNKREVKLKGEATFEVTKGSPFSVITTNGIVRVLGTKFNVRAWNNKLVVECFSGKVSVENDNSKLILNKGESISFIDGKIGTKNSISHQEPYWKNKIIKFNNEEVVSVFAELERQYNIKVNWTGKSTLFTGSFITSSLESALDQICRPLGLTYNINQANKTVTIED